MANILKPKRRTADGTAPTTGNLQDGEFAINTFARAIYQRVGANVIMVANYFSGAFADLSGKPTTLAGYGITDGIRDDYAASGTIPSGADLDTYTATGFYHQNSNASAAAGTNYPAPYAGMLAVYSTGTMVYQTYQRYASPGRWHRSYYNGTWSAWATEWNSSSWAGPGVLVSAGNGLTGGGSIGSNRTISMGTPGTLTGSTTNDVTTSSHTHALSANLSAWDAIDPSAKQDAGSYISAGGTNYTTTDDWRIAANTASGSDTRMLRFVSGGGFHPVYGAILELSGAQAATNPGGFRLLSTANSSISVGTNTLSLVAGTVAGSGTTTMTGEWLYTTPIRINTGGIADIYLGANKVNGVFGDEANTRTVVYANGGQVELRPAGRGNGNGSLIVTTSGATLGGQNVWAGSGSPTNIPTQAGDLLVAKTSAVIGVGVSALNAGMANFGADGTGALGLFSNFADGAIYLRPNGRTSSVGQVLLTPTNMTIGGNTVYHEGNISSVALAISNTTGLQAALDSKAAATHNHDAAYAAASHNHDGAYLPISNPQMSGSPQLNGPTGRLRFTIASGWAYLQAGDPDGDNSGGKMRLSGWVATQLDELRIDAVNANINGVDIATVNSNVASATKLATARTIGGVSFDGTANINLPGVNATGTQNTTGTAAAWTTARTLSLAGVVTGSASVKGDANVSLTTSIASGALTIANTSGLQTALDGKAAVAHTHAWADITGVVPTWNQNTTGTASKATTLATARTINGTSFNGSANITTASWGTARTLTLGSTGKSVNGSANVSWTLAEMGAVANGGSVATITNLTQAAYDALGTKDANTLYAIVG